MWSCDLVCSLYWTNLCLYHIVSHISQEGHVSIYINVLISAKYTWQHTINNNKCTRSTYSCTTMDHHWSSVCLLMVVCSYSTNHGKQSCREVGDSFIWPWGEVKLLNIPSIFLRTSLRRWKIGGGGRGGGGRGGGRWGGGGGGRGGGGSRNNWR